MRVVQVAPSLLAADLTRLEEEVRSAEAAGVDMLHFDVMDGVWVPNLTFGPGLCAAVARITKLPLDVHLMVANPDALLEPFVAAGARRLAVHVEAVFHLHRTLSQIRELGASPGIALNPLTPLVSLEEVWPFVDFVLLMTVNPGFGGQTLIPETVEKLARLNELRQVKRPEVHLAVDGGVTVENAPSLVACGADTLVVGTAFFGAEDRAATVAALKGGKA